MKMNTIIIAIIIIIVVSIFLKSGKNKECMSGKEVFNKTNGNLNMSYEKFREKVPELHSVNYYDLRGLHKNGQYTPDNIDKTIN